MNKKKNYENQVDINDFFNEALTIIGLGANPFFKTKVIAEKVIDNHVGRTKDHRFLKRLLSRRIGVIIKPLRQKGYIEKFSKSCWRRKKKFLLEDIY